MCPQKEGAFKAIKISRKIKIFKDIDPNSLLQKKSINFRKLKKINTQITLFHLSCVIWNPKLRSIYDPKKNVLDTLNLDEELHQYSENLCHLCNEKNVGFVVKCMNNECNLYFHVECGRKAQYLFDKNGEDFSGLYCLNHFPYRLKRIIFLF